MELLISLVSGLLVGCTLALLMRKVSKRIRIEDETTIELPKGVGYIGFCIALQEHKKAGFSCTQEDADRIAALFNTEAPRFQTPASTSPG